jgi:hypothetical protein
MQRGMYEKMALKPFLYAMLGMGAMMWWMIVLYI